MRLCADATTAELAGGIAGLGELPGHRTLRSAETGLVMLRGRTGGDGAPFNLGEATVTRAAVGLDTGEIGHACLLGRSTARAEHAALIDALVQCETHRDAIETVIAAPIRQRITRELVERQARTSATRVDFFTLVRGEA